MVREPRDYALLIGVQHYPKYAPFNNLEGPHKDVMALKKWLLDDAKGGGLDPGNCKDLLSQPDTPIHDDVDAALNQIFDAVKKYPEGGRRLYIYFSGHGLASDIFGVDLCLVKWSLRNRNYALSSTEYKRLTGESGLFDEVVWWLDCCRSAKQRAHGRKPAMDWANPRGSDTRFFTAYATESQNSAFEAELNDNEELVPGQARGYFTKALLAALWGQAADEGGGVTAVALKQYLTSQVPVLAQADERRQKPVVENGLDNVDGNPAKFGQAMRSIFETNISFTDQRNGTIVLHGPKDIVRQDDAGTGPWLLSLDEGALHVLEEKGSGDLYNFRPSTDNSMITF